MPASHEAPTVRDVRAALRAEASAADSEFLQRYFKTGPGEYGEGDRFLGVRVPALRGLVKRFRALPVDDVLALLRSEWHEERLLALLLLVEQYLRGDAARREEIHQAYLANTAYVNNWDLVDSSAPTLVGAHLPPGSTALLDRLSRSGNVWERRIAMLATAHGIRAGDFAPALRIAGRLLDDRHDLIHKAVGWMLREIGKRDRESEESFLRAHYRRMPRTMLRYAIERFPEELRQRYLRGEI